MKIQHTPMSYFFLNSFKPINSYTKSEINRLQNESCTLSTLHEFIDHNFCFYRKFDKIIESLDGFNTSNGGELATIYENLFYNFLIITISSGERSLLSNKSRVVYDLIDEPLDDEWIFPIPTLPDLDKCNLRKPLLKISGIYPIYQLLYFVDYKTLNEFGICFKSEKDALKHKHEYTHFFPTELALFMIPLVTDSVNQRLKKIRSALIPIGKRLQYLEQRKPKELEKAINEAEMERSSKNVTIA